MLELWTGETSKRQEGRAVREVECAFEGGGHQYQAL